MDALFDVLQRLVRIVAKFMIYDDEVSFLPDAEETRRALAEVASGFTRLAQQLFVLLKHAALLIL